MAQSDWTVLSDSLAIGVIDRGVTTGIARPNGGGNFVHAFNSLAVATGASGLFTNQVNFAPMAKGGSIRFTVKRLPSGGLTGFAPMAFIGLQGNSVNNLGYLLGLSDNDPSHIVLKKGAPSAGLADAAPDPGVNGILLRSNEAFDNDTWLHLRLDMIVNDNGDVILQVFRNDLDANAVSAPVWVALPGMEEFVDDALSINSGSAPYVSGRAGFAMYANDVTRRAAFDHVAIARQL
jgi:hypothetical protein